MIAPLLAVLLLAPGASAAPRPKLRPAKRAQQGKAAPAKAAPAAAASAAPEPKAEPAKKSVSRDEAVLFALGLSGTDARGELRVSAVRPGSPAAEMGLKPGDRVWSVDRGTAATRGQAAALRLQPPPEMRESLVARRGLAVAALEGPESPAPAGFERGSKELSAREAALAEARASREASRAKDAVSEAPPLDWALRADQSIWVRFPDGIPAGAAKDRELEAVTAAALTADASLDFLAVPPGSVLKARVLESQDDGAVRTVRLAFRSLRLKDGRDYPIHGVAQAVANVEAADLVKVTVGGTIVSAAPLPEGEGRRRREDLLLDGDARLKVRLFEPVSLAEPASWWRAGPGLWIKTAEADGKRRYEVSHVAPGRSAAAAGLKVGDVLVELGGRAAERLEFAEALDALYGAPGSTVKVGVLRPGRTEELELARGVKVEGGASTRLPLPFETR